MHFCLLQKIFTSFSILTEQLSNWSAASVRPCFLYNVTKFFRVDVTVGLFCLDNQLGIKV